MDTEAAEEVCKEVIMADEVVIEGVVAEAVEGGVEGGAIEVGETGLEVDGIPGVWMGCIAFLRIC